MIMAGCDKPSCFCPLRYNWCTFTVSMTTFAHLTSLNFFGHLRTLPHLNYFTFHIVHLTCTSLIFHLLCIVHRCPPVALPILHILHICTYVLIFVHCPSFALSTGTVALCISVHFYIFHRCVSVVLSITHHLLHSSLVLLLCLSFYILLMRELIYLSLLLLKEKASTNHA